LERPGGEGENPQRVVVQNGDDIFSGVTEERRITQELGVQISINKCHSNQFGSSERSLSGRTSLLYIHFAKTNVHTRIGCTARLVT
jgi:hypothetical protein